MPRLPAALLTAFTAAAALATSLTPSLAEAHGLHVRFGGGVRVSGGVLIRVGRPAPPPPPVYYATYPSYPSYQPYYAPAPAVVAPAEPRRPMFGLGVMASSIALGNDNSDTKLKGEGVGLLGRLRLTRRFQLELQLSQDRFFDNPRIDSRFGAAAIFDLGEPGGFTPYLVLGTGLNVIQPLGEQRNVDASTLPTQGYLEAGIGLEWEIFPHLALSGDLRLQARRLDTQHSGGVNGKLSPVSSMPSKEDAAEGRVNLIVYF